jgi:hypothetical protein
MDSWAFLILYNFLMGTTMLKILKMLHLIGLIMLAVGVYLYLNTTLGQQVSGMLVIALLIGIGTLIMSPLPVALVIEWARKQPFSDNLKE